MDWGGEGTRLGRETSPDEGLRKLELRQQCSGDVAAGINVTSRKGLIDMKKFDYQSAWKGARDWTRDTDGGTSRVEDKISVGVIGG